MGNRKNLVLLTFHISCDPHLAASDAFCFFPAVYGACQERCPTVLWLPGGRSPSGEVAFSYVRGGPWTGLDCWRLPQDPVQSVHGHEVDVAQNPFQRIVGNTREKVGDECKTRKAENNINAKQGLFFNA